MVKRRGRAPLVISVAVGSGDHEETEGAAGPSSRGVVGVFRERPARQSVQRDLHRQPGTRGGRGDRGDPSAVGSHVWQSGQKGSPGGALRFEAASPPSKSPGRCVLTCLDHRCAESLTSFGADSPPVSSCSILLAGDDRSSAIRGARRRVCPQLPGMFHAERSGVVQGDRAAETEKRPAKKLVHHSSRRRLASEC